MAGLSRLADSNAWLHLSSSFSSKWLVTEEPTSESKTHFYKSKTQLLVSVTEQETQFLCHDVDMLNNMV